MKPIVYVFGEIHTNKKSVADVTEKIKKIKPDIIMHELLYSDLCNEMSTIRMRLNTCRNGNLCDPRINIDIYRLGLELKAKLVGIDLDKPGLHLHTLKVQFFRRETNMLKLVKRYTDVDTEKKLKIVIVVGDTHLRETFTKDLGKASPLMEYAKLKGFNIERAPKEIQEVP